ncbi:MAG: transglycosylase domain-containing protein [Clostridiales bacterium]|nr:transglycosylase domain-containing protein [Candidatus Crickella caballi]
MSRIDRYNNNDNRKETGGGKSSVNDFLRQFDAQEETESRADSDAFLDEFINRDPVDDFWGQDAKQGRESYRDNTAAKNTAKKPSRGTDEKKEYKKLRKKEKRKHSVFGVVLRVFLVLFFIGIFAGGGYAAYCIAGAPTIHPDKIYDNLDISTNIYDDEGELVETIYYLENRKVTRYEEMPENLVNAFIAIEDKTFWTHHGFNFKRLIGAILKSLGGGGISGTSTITQQLARNVFLSEIKSERSIKRKIIEMYYAYEIEQQLSKEEIIEAYLNTIYLGYGCYGVNSAARTYFSANVEDLTLEQCAALAALPQAPDSYALIKSEEGEKCTKIKKKGVYANDISEDRRNLVLSLMKNQGLVSEDDAQNAKKPLKDFIKPNLNSGAAAKSYFKDYLIQQVISDLMDEYGKTEEEARNMVYAKGLKIYSTMDTKAQKIVAKEFKDESNFPKDVKGDYPEAAMAIVEVGTGQVKALAGGRDPQGQMLFNRAVNTRQPGSSIKPLAVYGAALQKSFECQAKGDKFSFQNKGNAESFGDYITTSSSVLDAPIKLNGSSWPRNADGGYSGSSKTFRRAIQLSLNTCAVRILQQVGVDYSRELLKSWGITTIVDDANASVNDNNLAALALGAMSNGVTPLEMACAYAAFPGGGVVNTPICYTSVEDSNGNVLLTGKSETSQVLDPGVAWIMTDVLKSVVTDGIATSAKISGVKVGGKTGTTNDRYDIWFDGFTANYAAALWIGTDKNVRLTTTSGAAAKLWSKIMGQIPKAKEGDYKKKPSNVVKVGNEYYTKGTVPSATDSNDLNPDGSVKEPEKEEAGTGYDEAEGTEGVPMED